MNSVNQNFEKEEVTEFDGKLNVPGEDNEYVAQSMPFQCRYLDLWQTRIETALVRRLKQVHGVHKIDQ